MSLSVTPPTLYATPPIEFFPIPSSSIPLPPSSGSSAGSGSTAGGPGGVSQEGQLLSDLQNFQAGQPQKFQAALAQAAGGLTAAAQQAGLTTPQGHFLTNSAAQLQKAASAGDVAVLQPPAATNAVEQLYRPNEIGGGRGVLALLTSQPPQTPTAATPITASSASSTAHSSASAAPSAAATSSSGKTAGLTIPALFAQSSRESTNASSIPQSISEVIRQLQEALSG